MYKLIVGKQWDAPHADWLERCTDATLKTELMAYLRKQNIVVEDMVCPTAIVSEQTGKILNLAYAKPGDAAFPVCAKTMKLPPSWPQAVVKMFKDHHEEAQKAGKKCFIGLYAVQRTPYYSSLMQLHDVYMIRFAVKYY